ncbi:hypothetical protein LCGC14_2288980 [marine sediment metagenome]|uniref:Uncharacterized protein n=1 Tax=marine sediment metagenome TaxID=412755 RepID=A0A0F9CRN1_9ZZZZ
MLRVKDWKFPTTHRSGWILYRLLQLRFAHKDQILKLFFPQESKAQLFTYHISKMVEQGLLAKEDNMYWVTSLGRQILLFMKDNPDVPKEKLYADVFNQINKNEIEDTPNKGNPGAEAWLHRRMIAETLIHFFGTGYDKTDSKIELKVKDLPDIKPDNTIISDRALGFIECENKTNLKETRDKIIRYTRYYFSGDFHSQFNKEYARVFMVVNDQKKLDDLVKFVMEITFKKVGFKEPIHQSNDYVGRNLFRFSLLDINEPEFRWWKAVEWTRN